MKEHPILFKTEMVRAILAGKKTQTRRINLKKKYAIGDRLWIKETFFPLIVGFAYRADGVIHDGFGGLKWRPSLFMPRSAARIILEITDLREEFLTEIDEDDAIAEGVAKWFDTGPFNGMESKSHRSGFREIWDAINGKGSFYSNPLVRVITFKVAVE